MSRSDTISASSQIRAVMTPSGLANWLAIAAALTVAAIGAAAFGFGAFDPPEAPRARQAEHQSVDEAPAPIA